MKRLALWLCLLSLSFVMGCAPSLDPTQASGMPDEIKVREIQGNWLISSEKDGNTEIRVNSSRKDEWTYFSFGQDISDPTKKPASWDLGFRRYLIKINGGVSGSGKVSVATLKGVEYDTLTQAPSEGFKTDVADSDDPDEEPDFVFNEYNREWYVYNLREHVLKPRKSHVYVVKVEYNYYKLQFLGYYNKDGISGFPNFRFSKIDPPVAE